jgi:flagellar biosynthesis protein FlhF
MGAQAGLGPGRSGVGGMQLQTFKAASMAEALSQVKLAMGTDAVILHTRTYQQRHWLGLRRHEVVEITAGRGLNVPERRRSAARPVPQPAPAPANPAAGTESNRRQLLETPAAGNAMMMGLSQEMTALKSAVQELVNQQRQKQAPQVPEELFDYYLNLIQNDVAEELAQQVIMSLEKQVRPEHLSQQQFMREKLAEQVERLLPTAGPIQRTKAHGPHVVALVGPTGVGKTTTIAKLAAELKLRQHRQVGLITLDTYRIAAIDQLRKYAEILRSPLRVIASPEDMREALDAMQDMEFVLIDTAGRSPKDQLKLNELKAFLSAASPDEVHLVLSTTASQDCVELAVSRFGDVGVDRIIFTKVDEAAHVGVVLNVLSRVKKSLSYITTGQDVAKDIEVGHGRRIAQLILGSGI